MGRKPNPWFQEEAVSDYKNRPVGYRIKFRLKSNSVKMYDKCSVLRMETTISNLYRYAEVAKSCNQRFLDSMTDIVPVRSTLDEIRKVCSGKKMDGKAVFPDNKIPEKLSSKTRRLLKKLRQHGLIKKVPRSRRYHVTSKRIFFIFFDVFSRKYHIFLSDYSACCT